MSAKKGKAPSRQQQQAQAQARRQRPTTGRSAGAGPSEASGAAEVSPRSHEPARATGDQVTTTYVDVAAVRIQSWLGRTPGLKFRRGASIMLDRATEKDAWHGTSHLPAGVEWNDDAGEVSGVVPLRLTPTGDTLPTPEQAARAVAARLRVEMPYLAVQAVGAEGTSYIDAYPALQKARRQGDFLVDSPAPATEAVLARPCALCLAAPASRLKVPLVKHESKDLCNECLHRLEAAGLTTSRSDAKTPLPERRLLGRLQHKLKDAGRGQVTGFSDHFLDLATKEPVARDDASTQLALIYADGNRIGDFISAMAKWSDAHKTPDKKDVAVAIDQAAGEALAIAVIEALMTDASTAVDGTRGKGAEDPRVRPPVLVHVAGGDDLMVSVPAGRAWAFVCALLPAFEQQLADRARQWKAAAVASGSRAASLPPIPTLSAGIVFHHFSHPFADVAEKAATQLKAAKASVQGTRAAVQYLDLTSDGDTPTPDRPAPTAQWLTDNTALLSRLADVPASQRAALRALCRHAAQAAHRSDQGGEDPRDSLARRAVDLGEMAIWQVVCDSQEPTAELVGAWLADHTDDSHRVRLRHHLDLARWWPPTKPGSPTPTKRSHS